MTVAVFHLCMTGADILALLVATRRGLWVTLGAATIGLAATAVAFTVLLGPDFFLGARLVASALFVHMPAVLLLASWMRPTLRGRSTMIALAAVLWAIALNAFLVEPFYLEETRVTVTSRKVDQPLRIAILADLQADHIGDYERLALRRCLAHQPDLILMAGDYLQVDDPERFADERRRLREWLQEIDFSAPLGVFAVRGNTDRPAWTSLFAGLSIRLIEETQVVEAGPVHITGLEFMDSFQWGLEVPSREGFHLVLGHAPDFARGEIAADLLVAGHTHGGQVRLPLLGPVVTASSIPRAWAAGVTQLDGERTLIVSRGIGMQRRNAPRLRFLCRPELVMVDVVPVGD